MAKLGSSDVLAAGYVLYGEDTARDLTRRMDEAGHERTEGRASERGRPGGEGLALGMLNARSSGGAGAGSQRRRTVRNILCGQRTLTCEGCDVPIGLGARMRYGKRSFVCDSDECECEAARRHQSRKEDQNRPKATVVLGVATGAPVGRPKEGYGLVAKERSMENAYSESTRC